MFLLGGKKIWLGRKTIRPPPPGIKWSAPKEYSNDTGTLNKRVMYGADMLPMRQQ